MKTYSQDEPKEKFQIENAEGNKCIIVFFDNVKKEQDEEQNIIYNYDLYRLEIINRINLKEQIERNYNDWLELAKKQEYNKLAEEIRAKRDMLLAETDWTQVTDTALTKSEQAKYKEYRQKLRDIPEQPEFPYNVTFPCV